MNNRGIFSFLLFLILVQAGFVLEKANLESEEEMRGTLAMLEKAEEINFIRQEIELDFDYAIARTIQAGTIAGLDGLEIKNKIGLNTIKLFRQLETGNKGKIRFFIFEKPFSAKKEISFEGLYNNTRIIVIDSGKGVALIQFYATGNIEKNENIGAEISYSDAKQKFIVPIGYSHTEVAVGKSA